MTRPARNAAGNFQSMTKMERDWQLYYLPSTCTKVRCFFAEIESYHYCLHGVDYWVKASLFFYYPHINSTFFWLGERLFDGVVHGY